MKRKVLGIKVWFIGKYREILDGIRRDGSLEKGHRRVYYIEKWQRRVYYIEKWHKTEK